MSFREKRSLIENQYSEIKWIESSGLSKKALLEEVKLIEKKYTSKAIIKAEIFRLLCEKSRIAIDKDDIFQEKLFSENILSCKKSEWEQEVRQKYMPNETAVRCEYAPSGFGAAIGSADYGHTSPNSDLMLKIGFTGLLDRVERYAARAGLTVKQKDFYESCRIVLSSMLTVSERLAEAIKPYNEENSKALYAISKRAPENIYEAMQLTVLYFFMHEYVYGTRVRTLGRVDYMLYPFYKRDIENGVFTKEEIKDMLKFFLHKFWSAKVPFDLPFCLGGMDADGNEVTNELSYLIVEAYNEMDIYSPKIHIRVSDKTPESFVKLVLSCIRGGNSSFVFINDNVAVDALKRVGIEEKDAWNYTPIGCYEPAVWGVEIGSTGNGGVSLAKAVELVITNGVDHRSGKDCGLKTGKINTYDEFVDAVKKQIVFLTDLAVDHIVKIEKHYDKINPDPLLSCQYDRSVETGVDVYEGGAKYNNSSLYYYFIATLVDSVTAVKKLVFEDKLISFDELCIALKANWEGYEHIRTAAKRLEEKYGNGNSCADEIASEFTRFSAQILNGRPNGRGGVFKASLFSINRFVEYGSATMATPDGRKAGEPLSKNLCPSIGMDRKGVTALINSVTKMDHADFPNGSVLDVVLHPSAVSGDDGLDAFSALLFVYFRKGGFAMHGNVFNAETLKEAQKNPEKYKNLQVRVCGWNVYFVNLSKVEQDAFIKQAEAAALA